MALTVAEFGAEIGSVLGGRSRRSTVALANTTGNLCVNGHEWQYLQNQVADITIPGGQDYATLPADFRNIIDLQASDSNTHQVYWVSPRRLQVLRTSSNFVQTASYLTLSYRQTAIGTTGAPTQVLSVYPVNENDLTDVIKLWYRAKWAPVSADEDEISVPDWMEDVFVELGREIALGKQWPERGNVTQRVEAFKAGVLWQDAMVVDGMAAAPLGVTENGAASAEEEYYTITFSGNRPISNG